MLLYCFLDGLLPRFYVFVYYGSHYDNKHNMASSDPLSTENVADKISYIDKKKIFNVGFLLPLSRSY